MPHLLLSLKSVEMFGISMSVVQLQKVLTNSRVSSMSTEEQNIWIELWSRLHLLVLQTILLFPSLPVARQSELITLADMNQTVKDVVAHAQGVPGGLSENTVANAVNRLVQVLQVALATGAFRCSLSKSSIVID